MLQNHKKDWVGLLLGSKNQLPSENTVFVAHIFYFYTFEERNCKHILGALGLLRI